MHLTALHPLLGGLRVVFFLVLLPAATINAQPDSGNQAPDDASSESVVVDFHTHGFNFRHLPTHGILLRFGVPGILAGPIASIFEGATPTILDSRAFASGESPVPLRQPQSMVSARSYATELRAAIRDRIAPGAGPVAAAGDLCQAAQGQTDEVGAALREVCAEEERLDAFYRERASASALAGGARSAGDQALTSWLRSASALDAGAPTSAGGPEQALERMDIDLKIAGVVIAALAERDAQVLPHASAVAAGPGDLVSGVLGGLQLVYTLMQREDELVSRLRGTYPDVDLFVMHMMDMTRAYSDLPRIPFSDQIRVMRQLTENDPGLVFFGAYDPFRTDPRPRFAEQAMAAGAKGLKYYPPSGYRASDMAIPDAPKESGWFSTNPLFTQWQSRYGDLGEEWLREYWADVACSDGSDDCWLQYDNADFFDASQRHFFERALNEEWTLFSHQTPAGFESASGYSHQFADPCYWGEVLTASEPMSDLRLVLAHSGGNGWYMRCEDPGSSGDDCPFPAGAEREDYANYWRQAFNLCALFENVYCDLGYNSAVLSSAGQANLRERLLTMHHQIEHPIDTELVEQLTNGSINLCEYSGQAPQVFPIFDKLLYGSDWSMVVQTAGHEDLRQAYQNVFTGELAVYADAFYGGNALRVLGMEDFEPESLVAERAEDERRTVVLDDREFVLVEGDMLVLSSNVENFDAQGGDRNLCAGNVELTVNVDRDGNDTIWRDQCDRRISYQIRESDFTPSQLDVLRSDLALAAQDWRDACPECGVEFRPTAETDSWGECRGIEFEVKRFDMAGVWAAAFFPDFIPAERKLRVNPIYFEPASRGGPPMPGAGVMRHELGHILGYRHEHILGPRPCAWEGGLWRALGEYDPGSVMHYLCAGASNDQWTLSEPDKLLHQQLYGGRQEDSQSCG